MFLCDASYVGETYRHISIKTHENLEIDKSSNIYQHLKNPKCKPIYDEDCFSILDLAKAKYTLKLKEGMHIKWLKLSPNKIGKIHFALDSSIEKKIHHFSMSSNIMPFR